jgi:2-keto-3-deoxy-L-rhamnonate aldolase RhmA
MSILGYAPANYTEPEFLEAIDTIAQVAQTAGVKIGILAPDGIKGRAYRDRFDMVGCGGDVKALQGWMATAQREVSEE